MESIKSLLKEFSPSLLFLGKFLALYLSLNFLYGIYINSYFPQPDPVTVWATHHTAFVLDALGAEIYVEASIDEPKVRIKSGNKIILSVFEGCSGLNVGIIFLAFILSFSKPSISMFWFIPSGLLVIHLANLTRISLLYYVTIYMPNYIYFTHKYLFTGFLYLIILGLWYIWLVYVTPKAKQA